jgi:recombinational DNA repair protein (RecF pathway)
VIAVETWIAVSRQALADAGHLQDAVRNAFRLADLAMRGFGPHRCARCHRPVRCVYVVLAGPHTAFYGRTCLRKANWR